MKRFSVLMWVMVVPVGAVANTCPTTAPTGGCICPAGVTVVRVGSCNANEIAVVQGNCTGCDFASGAGTGNLTFRM